MIFNASAMLYCPFTGFVRTGPTALKSYRTEIPVILDNLTRLDFAGAASRLRSKLSPDANAILLAPPNIEITK